MKKGLRITFNAPLVLGFALACSIVTLIGSLTGESSTARLFATYSASPADPLMYVRLFTHVLGHAGFIHLVNNMAYILLLGPGLEEKYGAKNLLIVILVTAVITGVVHNLLFPNSALLGASGFINGIRYKNTSDLDEYLSALSEGRLPVAEEHRNTAFDNISEAVFTGLRRREGISYEDAVRAYLEADDAEKKVPAESCDFRGLFWDIFAEAKEEAQGYAGRGLLIIDNEGLRLTEQGIDISNSIMSLFV